MKVLFVLPNISVGGVERVRLTLIEYLASRGIECRLALRECRGELLERARQLTHVDELAPRGLHQFIPSLVQLLKREQPTHVVTAFPDIGLLTSIAIRLARSRARWVHTVDVAAAVDATAGAVLDRLLVNAQRYMARYVHRRVDAVVAVSEGVRADLMAERTLDPQRVAMLYNPVVPDSELGWRRAARKVDGDPCRIVAVGRLTRQKGFDILVNAMVQVRGSWRLSIWGDGVERSNLLRLVTELGLQDRIQLCGFTSNPFRTMRGADMFVMPSRYEGFGNVLVEALACQCQVIAADCPHGPREILQDGRLGRLVPVEDVNALAEAIRQSMNGQHGVDSVLLLRRARDFSSSKCGSDWEQLLRQLYAP